MRRAIAAPDTRCLQGCQLVERTFARAYKKRRLVVDFEKLPETRECFIYIARVHLMLRRLA